MATYNELVGPDIIIFVSFDRLLMLYYYYYLFSIFTRHILIKVVSICSGKKANKHSYQNI